MKTFDIWCEGYRCSGESSGAMSFGTAEGETFKDACIKKAQTDKDFETNFDPDKMTYWGCKLFDNAADAVKTFG